MPRLKWATMALAALLLPTLTAEKTMATTMTREKTAIEHAIDRGDAREVERLARAGADLEVPLFNRGTAAIIAASRDQWDIVRILLENGANPAAKDRRGTTLAAQARRSRVRPDTALYRDLEAARAILGSRGCIESRASFKVYAPYTMVRRRLDHRGSHGARSRCNDDA